MFKSRAMSERTLDTVQEGIERGRDVMGRAVGRGQQAIQRMLQPKRSPLEDWLWFAGGMAAGMGLILGWRRAAARPWAGRQVGDVMVRNVQTIDGSMNCAQAAQRMRDANVGVLPVVEGGRIRGIVTDRDLVIRGMATGMDPSTIRVADVATDSLVAARPDWPLEQAMETMAEHQIGRLPVVDENDRVAGIVTLSSLALRSARHDETLDTAKQVSRRSARAVS